jgi:hypothetical protein
MNSKHQLLQVKIKCPYLDNFVYIYLFYCIMKKGAENECALHTLYIVQPKDGCFPNAIPGIEKVMPFQKNQFIASLRAKGTVSRDVLSSVFSFISLLLIVPINMSRNDF